MRQFIFTDIHIIPVDTIRRIVCLKDKVNVYIEKGEYLIIDPEDSYDKTTVDELYKDITQQLKEQINAKN